MPLNNYQYETANHGIK